MNFRIGHCSVFIWSPPQLDSTVAWSIFVEEDYLSICSMKSPTEREEPSQQVRLQLISTSPEDCRIPHILRPQSFPVNELIADSVEKGAVEMRSTAVSMENLHRGGQGNLSGICSSASKSCKILVFASTWKLFSSLSLSTISSVLFPYTRTRTTSSGLSSR